MRFGLHDSSEDTRSAPHSLSDTHLSGTTSRGGLQMEIRTIALLASGIALAGCATTGDPATLGTTENPVKVRMPPGERAYLDRLRCPDGSAPDYDRQGSGMGGRDGHIVDFYSVTCPGAAPVTVVMDMYHSNREDRPVPGFSIVPRGD
jgi:hypothetical protein